MNSAIVTLHIFAKYSMPDCLYNMLSFAFIDVVIIVIVGLIDRLGITIIYINICIHILIETGETKWLIRLEAIWENFWD